MSDLPSGAALLALARDVLTSELMPLLPEERLPDALRVARCMAIAQRLISVGAGAVEIPELMLGGFRGFGLPLRRFACELRIGAFENSRDREACARAILWRLTVAKLRRSNPEFLAANGFD